MNRNDNSNYFLYIEPDAISKSTEPIDDIYTESVNYHFNKSLKGIANYSNMEDDGTVFSHGEGWRGCHTTDCGEHSSNCEYLFQNGFITNSLCVYYVKWYRDSIVGENLKKLEILKNLYETEK